MAFLHQRKCSSLYLAEPQASFNNKIALKYSPENQASANPCICMHLEDVSLLNCMQTPALCACLHPNLQSWSSSTVNRQQKDNLISGSACNKRREIQQREKVAFPAPDSLHGCAWMTKTLKFMSWKIVVKIVVHLVTPSILFYLRKDQMRFHVLVLQETTCSPLGQRRVSLCLQDVCLVTDVQWCRSRARGFPLQ